MKISKEESRTKDYLGRDKKIKELLKRGVENVYPSPEWLEKKLKSSEKIKVFLGIDPTAPTLHIGHAITLMKLKAFQELGHQVVLLIGSFTGMIGDPTDKAAARKPLTRKQVLLNAKKYKKQASTFISFTGKNPAKLVYNHKWLDKLTLKNVAELGMLVTAQQLLERDMFQERTKKGAPVYFTELMYPLLQGYDSVAMGVDGELGGNDQTFNMLMGRDLLKKIKNKEKFVLAMKLLTDPSGKKMGKSEGNMITLEDKPEEMFGKIMSWPDEFILPGMELLTFKTEEEIEKSKKALKKGNPRDIKLELAGMTTAIYHGEKKAGAARENWEKIFSEKSSESIFKVADIIEAPKGETGVVDFLYTHGLSASKGEARRLVEQGGVKTDGKKASLDTKIKGGEVVKIGKKKFVRVKNN